MPHALLLALALSASTTSPPAVAQALPSWAAPQEPAPAPAALEPPPVERAPPPFPVPLDPLGLTALVLAGGAYAARQLRRRP